MANSDLEDIGLYYFKNILPAELQTELLAWVCSKEIVEKFTPAFGNKSSTAGSGRVVCQFGYEYLYHQRDVGPSDQPIPEILANSVIKLANDLLEPRSEYFNQIIINKYKPGECITAHTDLYKFGEFICCFSLNYPATMKFKKVKAVDVENAPDTFEIVAGPGSVYLMSGPSRHKYTHEMLKTRGARWSITLRHVRST